MFLYVPPGNKTGINSYFYVADAMTWLGAQSYCRQYYTDLASVTNTVEDTLIKGLVPVTIWIGLFRDSWKWTDQSTPSIITWMPGKPDNSQGNGNCGYINNFQVGDAQCSDTAPFFCYSGEFKFYSVLNSDVC